MQQDSQLGLACITPEAAESHDMEGLDVKVIMRVSLLYKAHDLLGIVLVAIENLIKKLNEIQYS